MNLEKSGFEYKGSIFIVSIIKRLAEKLHRIILLHFGLTARIHLWENLNNIVSMVFGLGGRDHDSRNQYFKTNLESNSEILRNLCFGKIEHFEHCGNDGPNNPEDPCNEFSKILNM